MMNSLSSPRPLRLIALAMLGSLLGVAIIMLDLGPAASQDRGRQDRGRGRTERAPAEAPAKTNDANDEAPPAAEADVVEGDEGKVKVFKFSGLDISGRLRSPQLLYFLNRLRAEFNRPKLPHRSFIPELVRSSKEDEF